MVFKKENDKKYRITETDIKKFIRLIGEEINKEKEIKMEHTPEMFFKYRHDSGIITLGCTDIMSDEEIDPDNASEEDVVRIISDRIKGLSVFKETNHIWIHEINVLVFDVKDENGNHVLDENGEKCFSKQLEVFGFIKMENDSLFEHLEDESAIAARHKDEKEKMNKKLEDMINASK